MPDWADSPAEATYSVTATYSAEVTYSAETTTDGAAQKPYYDYPAPHAGHVPHPGHVSHSAPADGWQQPYVPAAAPGPSPHLVQARRRTLTMVLLITVAVMGSAFIGLTPWWTAVPPFLMLGAYMLLLREAARADTEHAHRWAEAEAFRPPAGTNSPVSAPARPKRSPRRSQRPRSSPSPRRPAGTTTSSTISTPTLRSAPC